MEENERETLPTEVWCHIFTFVDDFDDIMALKITNRLFYQELGARDPLMSVDKAIKISEEIRNWFRLIGSRGVIPRELLPVGITANEKRQINFTAIFLGPTCTGRTAFLHTFMEGAFKKDTEATLGVEFHRKEFVDPDGVTTRMMLWDTNGLEQTVRHANTYLKGAQAVFLTFGLDRRDSFVTSINRWLPQLYKNFCHHELEDQPVIYLLGLKSDLEHQIPASEAKALARALKIKYFECSAKLNENVNEVIEEMKNDLLKTVRAPIIQPTESHIVPDPKESHVPANDRRCLIQ